MKTYRLGDRLIFWSDTYEYDEDLIGNGGWIEKLEGTIVVLDDDNGIGVQLIDKKGYGHNLSHVVNNLWVYPLGEDCEEGWWVEEKLILEHYPAVLEYDPNQQGDTEDDI